MGIFVINWYISISYLSKIGYEYFFQTSLIKKKPALILLSLDLTYYILSKDYSLNPHAPPFNPVPFK